MRVEFTKTAYKALASIPAHILTKVKLWSTEVELHGIRAVRIQPGYHDEPLKGQRQGQRSIRLNKAYRLIYVETARGDVQIISVIEVSKHEY